MRLLNEFMRRFFDHLRIRSNKTDHLGRRCIPFGCRCKISEYPYISAILRLVGRAFQGPKSPTYFFRTLRVSYIQPNVGLPAAVAADSVTFCFAFALGDNMRLS